MTISNTNTRMDYVGNGATATYSYNFKIFAATDLVVTQEDTAGVITTLVLNTDYTVTGVGNTGGGSITLTAGNLPTGYKLTIRRVVPLTQGTDIRTQGDFFPDVVEDEFDILAMQSQQLQEQLNRALTIPATSTASTSMPLPVASKYLRWNSTATAIELVDNADLSAIVSPMTTKGDLLTRNSSGYERLTVGSDGQILIADTASTGGMKWSNTISAATTFTATVSFTAGVKYAKGTDIASAATITIPNDGTFFDVTGNTTITGIATKGVGFTVTLHFTGSPTLTHSSSFYFPDAQDYTVKANDILTFYEFATGSWIMTNKSRSVLSVKPAFSAHKNGTNQTLSAVGTDVLVTFSTEDFDTTNDFTSNRFTPSVAGRYQLSAATKTTGGVSTASNFFIKIYKNGVAYKSSENTINTGFQAGVNISVCADANGTTDYFEVYVRQDVGTALTLSGASVDTWVTGSYIG